MLRLRSASSETRSACRRIGYRITVVKLGSNGLPAKYETFAEGWLQKEGAWGRPADLINAPDGALLVSDDMNGVIYKISH